MIVHPLEMPSYLEGDCEKCKHPYTDHKYWCYDLDLDNLLRVNCENDECECNFTITDNCIDWER